MIYILNLSAINTFLFYASINYAISSRSLIFCTKMYLKDHAYAQEWCHCIVNFILNLLTVFAFFLIYVKSSCTPFHWSFKYYSEIYLSIMLMHMRNYFTWDLYSHVVSLMCLLFMSVWAKLWLVKVWSLVMISDPMDLFSFIKFFTHSLTSAQSIPY